jgi:hypothetical protein
MNTPQAHNAPAPQAPLGNVPAPQAPKDGNAPKEEMKRLKLHASPAVQQLSPMLFSDSVNPYGTERELSTADLDVDQRMNWPASLVQEDGVIVYGHRRIAAVKSAILLGTLSEDATIPVMVKPVMSDQERIIAAIAENERRKTPSCYGLMLAYDALLSTGMKAGEAVKHFRKRDGSAQDASFGSNLSAIRKACEKSTAFEDAVKAIGNDTGHRVLYNLVQHSKGAENKLTVEGLEKMAARMMDGSYTTIRDEKPQASSSSSASDNASGDSDNGEEAKQGAPVTNVTGKALISTGAGFKAIEKAKIAISEAEAGEYDVDSFKAFLKLSAAIFNGVDGYTKQNPKKLLKAFALVSTSPAADEKKKKKAEKE